jgi:hypothetical protein
MKPLLQLLFAAILFCACENKKPVANESKPNRAANSITFKESGGVKLKRAFLMFDDGRVVPSDNKAMIGEQVNVRLIVEGWEEKDGKVYLGASEKITNAEGAVVLDEKDLFATFQDGIAPVDAQTITLSAVITGQRQPTDHYLVAFRVWDKTGKGEISGSYKLRIE